MLDSDIAYSSLAPTCRFLGFHKLLEAVLQEWSDDIAANQVSDIALGVGFLPIVTQFSEF